MLSWRSTNGTWFGNGFRIERRSPHSWVVIDNSRGAEQRLAEPILATMPSLKSAKHVAESRHDTERLNEDRKRLAIVALSMGVLAVLFVEIPLAAIAAGVIGGAAALEFGATYIGRFYGRAREVTQ
jgi:hypothetical protein